MGNRSFSSSSARKMFVTYSPAVWGVIGTLSREAWPVFEHPGLGRPGSRNTTTLLRVCLVLVSAQLRNKATVFGYSLISHLVSRGRATEPARACLGGNEALLRFSLAWPREESYMARDRLQEMHRLPITAKSGRCCIN
jgi:hypothetical protein